MDDQRVSLKGMHPGVVNGRRIYPRTNTCAPRSIVRLKRQLAGIEGHLAGHPRDDMSQKRAAYLRTLV